jgi:hypothetical protein
MFALVEILWTNNNKLKLQKLFIPVFNLATRHENVRGSGDIAPNILNLESTWR